MQVQLCFPGIITIIINSFVLTLHVTCRVMHLVERVTDGADLLQQLLLLLLLRLLQQLTGVLTRQRSGLQAPGDPPEGVLVKPQVGAIAAC